ncbi:MAG: ComEC/Rec2 family competence protein [Prolixibacteraceae bacterium]
MSATRNLFQKIPFIRITSLFLIGILLRFYFPFSFKFIAILITGVISTLILLWFASNYLQVRFQNTLIFVALILTGYFYPENSTLSKTLFPDKKTYFLAEVSQKPKEKFKSYQTILLIQNKILAKPEKVIAYFSKTEFDSTINIGDQLVITTRPQEIKNRNNPFEFDYEKLMHKKGIWYSIYLTKDNYTKTKYHVNRPNYIPERIREKLIAILTSAIPEKTERSVISALTLGYRTELVPETIDYFTSTGSMHVLAVSGLHVGLIYLILGYLFRWLKYSKSGKIAFPAVILVLLWTYAAITGFSASVQRATIMFSFIIIGETIQRPVNIYNSLSASALVLMLLGPDVIFEVGFQLSYMAVFGIVLIQSRLTNLIQIRNKILNFFWNLFTVSVAAQMATFPLAIFYFNQFPNYFWISNFIVIPAATLLIWLAFAFFILSPVPVLSQILAQVLSSTTSLMLDIMKWISELPHAVIRGIITTSAQTFLIYGILISLLIFLLTKKKWWFSTGFILVIVLQSTFIYEKFKLVNQHHVYVYNSENRIIHCINGRKNYIILNDRDSISTAENQMIQAVLDHRKLDQPTILRHNKESRFNSGDLIISGNYIQFLDCSMTFSGMTPSKSNQSDLLTFKVQNPISNKKELISTTITGQSPYLTEKQKKFIDHATGASGAFSLHLR